MTGADQFWMCLGFLIQGLGTYSYDTEVIPAVLPKVLCWWPEFCRLTSRMEHQFVGSADSPNDWATQATGWCIRTGLMTQEEHMALLALADPFAIADAVNQRITAAKATGAWPQNDQVTQ